MGVGVLGRGVEGRGGEGDERGWDGRRTGGRGGKLQSAYVSVLFADGRVPQLVKRVLDVERGKLCYVVGTVYTDMPLKPNVIEDLAREVSTRPHLVHTIPLQYRFRFKGWRLAAGRMGISRM